MKLLGLAFGALAWIGSKLIGTHSTPGPEPEPGPGPLLTLCPYCAEPLDGPHFHGPLTYWPCSDDSVIVDLPKGVRR